MNLQPVHSTPGLWQNMDWRPDTPGTFALVIGVSRYRHLKDGGDEPARDMYQLEQLHVSALTAYEFFLWLRDEYRYEDVPLAQCWLLLSPTEAEQTIKPLELDRHALLPTFANCETAITTWFTAMEDLPRAIAQQSRSFFFFSGHGVEVTPQKQLLLPCDYLNPKARTLDKALCAPGVAHGLGILPVNRHFFFFDACRNDHDKLKQANVQGSNILTQWDSSLLNPDRITPLFYATAAGQQAFQPDDPHKGALSIFGQALVEGLRDGAANRDVDPWSVDLLELQRFVKRRANYLITKKYQGTTLQRVKVDDSEEVVVAQIPISAGTTQQPVEARPPSLMDTIEQLYSRRFVLDNWHPLSSDWLAAHDIFGAEGATDPMIGARVYSKDQRNWLPAESGYMIHSLDRDVDTRTFRIVLSIPNGRGDHWLQFQDREGTSFGCALPGDAHLRPRYLLELDLEFEQYDEQRNFMRPRRFSRVEVGLALDNDGRLGEAARMWETYRTATVFDAAAELYLQFAEELLQSKLDSPLAATVAALILLRARRADLLHDWLRNLSNWFPDRPDGPVLWAEFLLQRERGGPPPEEAIGSLLQIQTRGLPQTADGLGYALRHTELFMDSNRLDEATRTQAAMLHERLTREVAFFRSGGLFTVFASSGVPVGPFPSLVTADLG